MGCCASSDARADGHSKTQSHPHSHAHTQLASQTAGNAVAASPVAPNSSAALAACHVPYTPPPYVPVPVAQVAYPITPSQQAYLLVVHTPAHTPAGGPHTHAIATAQQAAAAHAAAAYGGFTFTVPSSTASSVAAVPAVPPAPIRAGGIPVEDDGRSTRRRDGAGGEDDGRSTRGRDGAGGEDGAGGDGAPSSPAQAADAAGKRKTPARGRPKKKATESESDSDEDAPLTPLAILKKALRDTTISAKASRVFASRGRIDVYTRASEAEVMASPHDVDHVMEVQAVARAVSDTVVVAPYCTSDSFTEPLAQAVNDVLNLNVTSASVNRSKGQAVRLFLNRLGTRTEMSMLACMQNDSKGGQRQIYKHAKAMCEVLHDVAPRLIDEIQALRRDGYVVSSTGGYVAAAETLQEMVDIMDLNLDLDAPVAGRTRARGTAGASRTVYVRRW